MKELRPSPCVLSLLDKKDSRGHIMCGGWVGGKKKKALISCVLSDLFVFLNLSVLFPYFRFLFSFPFRWRKEVLRSTILLPRGGGGGFACSIPSLACFASGRIV